MAISPSAQRTGPRRCACWSYPQQPGPPAPEAKADLVADSVADPALENQAGLSGPTCLPVLGLVGEHVVKAQIDLRCPGRRDHRQAVEEVVDRATRQAASSERLAVPRRRRWSRRPSVVRLDRPGDGAGGHAGRPPAALVGPPVVAAAHQAGARRPGASCTPRPRIAPSAALLTGLVVVVVGLGKASRRRPGPPPSEGSCSPILNPLERRLSSGRGLRNHPRRRGGGRPFRVAPLRRGAGFVPLGFFATLRPPRQPSRARRLCGLGGRRGGRRAPAQRSGPSSCAPGRGRGRGRSSPSGAGGRARPAPP